MKFPYKLKKGDTVGLLAPSSHQAYDALHLVEKAIPVLESWGLKVKLQPGHDRKHFYLAGTDEHRARYFQEFYCNPEIKAIFITRGGYGASRLYPLLDDDLISRNQKIMVGLSDATSLLLYIHKTSGGIVYHGPNLASYQFHESPSKHKNRESLHNNLFQEDFFPTYHISTIKSGTGKGKLIGGNLSLVVTTLGTPYEIDTRDKVLFLEDTKEKPYRIDRMLTHLRNAGKFENIQGLVFGDMVGCNNDANLLWDVIEDMFGEANFPVVNGLPAGHGEFTITMPFGSDVEINTGANELRFIPYQ
ncbi:MAG: LD-carboxypeptidase [Proteobacteria bacterium]|nr:LD-carboxypeptidase [Pseudomonadota bacterium]